MQHNFETTTHQTKFRCQQSRGWSESEEVSPNPLRGWTGKMSGKEEGKGGQNLKGKMAKAVLTNTSGNIVPNMARNILIMKANEMHNFSNLFDKSTRRVSDRSTVHHQEYLNTVHTIGICHASSVGCLLAWDAIRQPTELA